MSSSHDELEIFVMAPLGRDAPLLCKMLTKQGYQCKIASSLAELRARTPDSVGVLLLAEEALAGEGVLEVSEWLAKQPTWSDLPIVLLTGGRRHQVLQGSLLELGNVTLLERPIEVRTLLSAVASAQRSRRRQYQGREEIRRRDEFLAMLGHELRNPLTVILYAQERLQDEGGTEHAEKNVATIGRQVRHLTRLVDDLLDVARVTTGKVVLDKAPVDLLGAVQDAVGALLARAHDQNLHLTWTSSVRELRVDGDRVRLDQVITNLLVNAIKYTPSGGQIEVLLDKTADAARIRFRDTGIGMDAATLENAFDLFTQAKAAIARTQGGMGVGLTLVRSLVDLHGGSIRASSEGPDQGSEFEVTLPLLAGHSAPLATSAPRQADQALRLVVIEDNPDLVELLKEMLEDSGHHVDVAIDGHEGLELIEAVKPDCAFIDIGLPGLDGYQVASAVRDRLKQTVKLVAMSGYGQPEDHRRAIATGFDLHLTKPVVIERLHRALRELMPA